MKKVILIVFMILSIDLYSQKINLTSLAGVWRWQDSATDSEFEEGNWILLLLEVIGIKRMGKY